jgi:hypothetical protein
MATKKKSAPKAKVEELEEELDDEIGEDLDEELDDDLDEDLDDDLGDEDGDAAVDDDEDDDDLAEAPAAPAKADDEDDEVLDADDVEASLDVILKERLVVEDEPEDEDSSPAEDQGDGTERVLPKQADEFVCNGCFVVKNSSQLANKKKGLCRDCA